MVVRAAYPSDPCTQIGNCPVAGLNRCSAIGFVIALCVSIGAHPSAAASSERPDVTFYLRGTCLCDGTAVTLAGLSQGAIVLN